MHHSLANSFKVYKKNEKECDPIWIELVNCRKMNKSVLGLGESSDICVHINEFNRILCQIQDGFPETNMKPRLARYKTTNPLHFNQCFCFVLTETQHKRR